MIMRRLIFLAPISCFLLLGLYFMAGLKRDPYAVPSMLIDRAVPEFMLPAVGGDGGNFSSADLKGDVVLVNVFASWCLPCLQEQPVLMQIAASGGPSIYGIDWKDKPGEGAAWLARNGDPYVKVGDDSAGRVAIDFGVTGAPETFVVDRNGRVRHKHVGPITPQVWRKTLKPMIEELKADAPDSLRTDAS